MRPAHKLLKRLLRHRAWEIDWRETTTGKLRADLLLVRPDGAPEEVPLHTTSTNPLTWLAWTEGHLNTVEVTPYVYPEVCDRLGLPLAERCYFMRHCRDAMARLCGRRAADTATLAALGAVPHHERLSRSRAVRLPQDARGRAETGAGSRRVPSRLPRASRGRTPPRRHPCRASARLCLRPPERTVLRVPAV